MTAQERATQAAFKTAEKFGPEEETWPLFARREIAKLRRDAHFEEFMANLDTRPDNPAAVLYTTSDITQADIERESIRTGRTEQDVERSRGLLGNKRQCIISRVQYRTELAGEELWIDGDDEYLATADAFLDVMMPDPNVRVHVTVEWRVWPEEKDADAL